MSDDQWETTSWDGQRDPWFTEPEWPTRRPALPPWSALDYTQLIPTPRTSPEQHRP